MENKLKHVNIDDTVKTLGIVQRGAFYTVVGDKNKHFFKGVETDNLGIMKQDLHTILMTPDIDKVNIESVGRQMLVCTMKRIGENEWEYELEDESAEE